MGMLVLEGYGLTETAPFVSINRPGDFVFGTVGRPAPGTEVMIDPATGEILVRGPQVMRGYVNDPAETARAIDADGWFHTGDIGELDEIGRIKITDRLKNIIVLANGKNVVPAPMEAALSTSKYVAQAVIVGDRICLLKMHAEIAQYDTPEKILTRPASEYVAEFLGRERLVRRMSVVRINPQTLDGPDGGPRTGEPRVPLSSTLTEAFAAALSSPTERAAVFDGDRYAGAFTATSLLESLRRESAEGGDNVAAGV